MSDTFENYDDTVSENDNDGDSEIPQEPEKPQKFWVHLIGYLIAGVVIGIFMVVPWKEIWKSINPFAESPKPIVVTADDMKKANAQEQPYQRFVPISVQQGMVGIPWNGFFALDTKTGQLCQTVPLGDTAPAWAQALPRCVDLNRPLSKQDVELLEKLKQLKQNDPLGILH